MLASIVSPFALCDVLIFACLMLENILFVTSSLHVYAYFRLDGVTELYLILLTKPGVHKNTEGH